MSLSLLQKLGWVFWSATGVLAVSFVGAIVTGVIDYRAHVNPPPVSIPLPATE